MNLGPLTVAVTALTGVCVQAFAAAGEGQRRIDPDRVLVGNMYAPFCRTLGPDEAEWEADIKRMSELGFTCLHGFCEWSRIERTEGVFDFGPTDRLVELCARHGIRAILNVATQNAVGYHTPPWLERRYAGKGVVDADGNGSANGRTHLLPCLDDPEYARYAKRYLTALAKHYAGDARVAGWVLWGEPSLYNNNGKPICYCEHTLAIFRSWLERRYGDIARLNAAWGTDGPVDFGSFAEVRAPRGAIARDGGYAAWSDWREFMNAHFAEIIAEADAIMKANGSTQPTIDEMYGQLGGCGACNDIWKLGASCDIVGASLFCRPGYPIAYSLVTVNSVAAKLGKSVFVVEECGGPRGYSYDLWTPTPEEIRSEAVQALGMGARGLMYWCWRPRFTDFEAGTYGMCRADGKPLPRARAGGETGARLTALGNRLADAEWRAEVGVLHLSRAYFADIDRTKEQVLGGECGAIRALLDLHVTPVLVDAEMLRRGLPRNLKALVLPFSYVMDPEETAAVAGFVRAGGTVLADGNLAFKRSDGTAYRNLPGGGLVEVFGFEKEDIIRLDDESLLPKDNVYGLRCGDFEDVFTPTTARVVERHGDNPIRVVNGFGKGRAHAFGIPLFGAYVRMNGSVRVRGILREILAAAGVRPFVSLPEIDAVDAVGVIAHQLTRPDGARILTFVNPAWKPAKVRAVVPSAKSAEGLVGPEIASRAAGDGVEIVMDLAPWQSSMVEVK